MTAADPETKMMMPMIAVMAAESHGNATTRRHRYDAGVKKGPAVRPVPFPIIQCLAAAQAAAVDGLAEQCAGGATNDRVDGAGTADVDLVT